jgi:putative transposase
VAVALKDIYRAVDAAADEAALKLPFLVLNRSEKEWIMPARERCMAKAQFATLFGERFTRALA